MKSSNIKHQIQWEHVHIDGIQVNGEKQPLMFDINAPVDGLFMVLIGPDGKEIERVKFPTKAYKAEVRS